MSFESEKERFCRNALGWIQSNLQEFDPRNKVNRKLRIKALSELLLVSYLHKRRFKTLAPPFKEFVSFGLDVVQKMKYPDGIHRRPELVLPYSIIYKSLSGCGTNPGTLKEDIQSMLDVGLPMASEDNPYRMMELRYALEDGDFKHLPPTSSSLYRNTSFHRALNDTPPILSLGLDQVYGLTHLVFYLTGFGFSRGSVQRLASLRWLVSAQLGLQTLERNWDAVAELLMCCSFLRYFPSPFYRSAWSSLLKAQKIDGSLTDNFFDVRNTRAWRSPKTGRIISNSTITPRWWPRPQPSSRKKGTWREAIPSTPASRRQQLPDYAGRMKRARAWLLKKYLDQSRDLELSSLLYVLVGDWIFRLSL